MQHRLRTYIPGRLQTGDYRVLALITEDLLLPDVFLDALLLLPLDPPALRPLGSSSSLSSLAGTVLYDLGFRAAALHGRHSNQVAVERIFSGARDVIGIRRARLQAETIRKLMLVKAQIRLRRKVVIDLIGDE
ncbi:hypothetical protein B0H13DRAFT_2307010 [Mycena leptocephala]|nr:hypothetical protein B0H13DRAFT_2307010 [Mycena leptocephala]